MRTLLPLPDEPAVDDLEGEHSSVIAHLERELGAEHPAARIVRGWNPRLVTPPMRETVAVLLVDWFVKDPAHKQEAPKLTRLARAFRKGAHLRD